MSRASPWIALVSLLVCAFSLVRLAVFERAGPLQLELTLDGGIPATLLLPGGSEAPSVLPAAPPPAQRAPAVVLGHGFAADRRGTSTLARRLAAAGYAVLSLDFRGHGANRNVFPSGLGRADLLFGDLAAAVDFLRGSPHVDGNRIVVMGHSMGAGAALDFATRDSGVDAVVAISGARPLLGPYRPPNVLLLVAAADPARTRDGAAKLAARLAGVETAEPDQRYGEIERGTALRWHTVAGADHLTILWSRDAAREIVAWLDACFAHERREPLELDDPRLGAALVHGVAFVLFLFGIGGSLGARAPAEDEGRGRTGAAGLAALAAASLLGLVLVAAATPASFLPLEVADIVVSQLALTGAVLLGLAGVPKQRDWRGGLPPGLIAFLAIYALLAPVGSVAHRLTPTPERLGAGIVAALLLLPYFLAFERLLRRGPLAVSTLVCVAGRLISLAILGLGVRLGAIPLVVALLLPTLALLFLLFEVFAVAVYAASRNRTMIAVVEAAWLGWIVAAIMPIRI